MSWSITINNLPSFEKFDQGMLNIQAAEHPKYPEDMKIALICARLLRMGSVTLTGMRAPNPYGGDEVIDVSIRGFPAPGDFVNEMRRIIFSGPQPAEAVPPDNEQQAKADYLERLFRDDEQE